MIYFAGIIERRLENILTYLTHHITNAVSEGLNAKISGSNTPRAASGIATGSSWRFSSISAVSMSTHGPSLPLDPLQTRKSHKP
jgi:hypothetical protein